MTSRRTTQSNGNPVYHSLPHPTKSIEMSNRFNKNRGILAKPKVCKPPPPPPPVPPPVGATGCAGVGILYNTGQEITIIDGVPRDAHWTIGPPATIWTHQGAHNWLVPPSPTAWIAASQTGFLPETATLTFTFQWLVDTAVNLLGIEIWGRFASDNQMLQCQYNGYTQNISCYEDVDTVTGPTSCRMNWHEFILPTKRNRHGLNTIQFLVDNLPGVGYPSPLCFVCELDCWEP